jgi:hypothetical protein
MEFQMKENYNKSELGDWKKLLTYPKNDLSFLTIIINSIPIDDASDYNQIKTNVNQDIDCFRRNWRTCLRDNLPGLIYRGAYEFDLIKEPMSGHKKQLFEDMNVKTGDRNIILHVHAVTASNLYDKDKIYQELSRTFKGRWRVNIKSLFHNQNVDEAIHKLHGYTNKQRLQYSNGGWGNEEVKFGKSYEPEFKKIISDLYKDINVKFRSDG